MHETKIREYRQLLFKHGLGPGDNIMLHADLRMFGKVEGGFNTIINELLSIIGEEGTIVTPAFTFTFPNTFNLLNSLSNIGGLTTLFSRHPSVKRVPDGITSYYIIGNKAQHLIKNWDNTSYGECSIIGQMLKLDGIILQFDTDILSLIHYVEQKVGVPYRKLKRFDGNVCVGNEIFKSFTYFYARITDVKKIIPDPIRSKYYAEKAKQELLNGRITRSFKMKDFVDYAKLKLTKDKMLLIQ